MMLGEAMADFELLLVGVSLQSSFYDSFLPAVHQVSLVALCAKRVGLLLNELPKQLALTRVSMAFDLCKKLGPQVVVCYAKTLPNGWTTFPQVWGG